MMQGTSTLVRYPGGRELASTKSSASFSVSSLVACSGDRGKAIRPVRADSRIPKGDMSLMNASIREGLAELGVKISVLDGGRSIGYQTYTSTMQLFVLISNTLPPN